MFFFSFHSRFATKEPNGLLLYNGRFNEKHDFIAVEIINQQIQLTFSAGTETTGTTTFLISIYMKRVLLTSPPPPLCVSQVRPKPQCPPTSSEESATACGTWWTFTITTR